MHPRLLALLVLSALAAVPAQAQTPCTSGMAGIYPCADVDLLARFAPSTFGATAHNDIWGWTDPDSRREFALLGRTNGTSFIEVTDPANPVFLGDLPMTAGARANLWRDIKVYRNHAFIVADGAGPHGMQVLDLTRLLRVAGAPVTWSGAA